MIIQINKIQISLLLVFKTKSNFVKMNLSNKLRSVALNVVNNEWCIRKSDYDSLESGHFCAVRPDYESGMISNISNE